MQKLLIISGQTATGKTDLGVYLAKKFNGEIVSFDSRQAYRYLDIVTGKDYDKLKITIKNLKLIKYFKNRTPIWLYDLYDPKEYINAYDFCQRAEIVIDDILIRKKLPIVVGGTIFYIKSFLEGFQSQGIKPDWGLRKRLEKLRVEDLQIKLKEINKNRFLRMNQSDRNNKRRLIRAIEIAQIKNEKLTHSTSSGLMLSKVEALKIKNDSLKLKKNKKYNYLLLALVLEKDRLKEKIERRVKKRIKIGAVEELKSLLKKGYNFDQPGLNTLGYKQLKDYFQRKITLEQAVNNWVRAEIDYARRQLVFLKKMRQVVFLNPEDKNFLEKTEKLVYKWYYESKD